MYAYICICTCAWVYICTYVGAFCLFVLSSPSTICECITGIFSTPACVCGWGISRGDQARHRRVDHIISWNLMCTNTCTMQSSTSKVHRVGAECNDHALISCTVGGDLLTYRKGQITVSHFGEHKKLHLESSEQNYYTISLRAKKKAIFTSLTPTEVPPSAPSPPPSWCCLKCVSPEGCVCAPGRRPEPTMTNWGNASKTCASIPQDTAEHNRRELVAFCQGCWHFTDFGTTKEQ